MINTKNTTGVTHVFFMVQNIEKNTSQNIGWIYKELGLKMELRINYLQKCFFRHKKQSKNMKKQLFSG